MSKTKEEKPELLSIAGEEPSLLQKILFAIPLPIRLLSILMLFGVSMGICLYVAGYVGTVFTNAFLDTSMLTGEQYIYNAFHTPVGKVMTTFFAILNFVITIILIKISVDDDNIKGNDVRGVNYSKDGTYGTAEFMPKEEAKKIFEVGSINNVEGVILGQYSDDGSEVLCLKRNTDHNRNILVLGSPGTGKSFGYVRNAIFQSIVRGESVAITDPKGELYGSMAETLKENGYAIKVLNLVDPKHSDSWNCVNEIYDPKTGNIDTTRATEFCDALMRNTGGMGGDAFWDSGENNLLNAIVLYCAWLRESSILAAFIKESNNYIIDACDKGLDENLAQTYIDIVNDDEHAFNERKDACLKILSYAISQEKIKEIVDLIEEEAPACNISTVYFMITSKSVSDLTEDFKKVPVGHPAKTAWNIFRNSGENTKPNMVQGLGQRLQLFQTTDIRRITMNDDIVLEDLGKEKIALFCIISDKSLAMRPITSMFFNFLFKDLADAADREGPENRNYVNVICDEFSNLGVLPQFDVVLSTVRSRKINISIILQSTNQLSDKYGTAAQTIIACCDTVLFLGCNDTTTAQFISDLSGIATIRAETAKSSDNGIEEVNTGKSSGDGKRALLNPDEVMKMKPSTCIVYHRGYNIIQLYRCGYILHKLYNPNQKDLLLSDYPLTIIKYPYSDKIDAFRQEQWEKTKNVLRGKRKNEAKKSIKLNVGLSSDDVF